MKQQASAAPVTEIVIDSPIGRLRLVATSDALTRIDFLHDDNHRTNRTAPRSPILSLAKRELDAYFRGRLRVFSVRLAPAGTEFQRDVWKELLSIPYGETTSYGAIARSIGRPSGFRAVGAANGSNPIPIIIPCHRVIGGDGSLTGYGGGIAIKRHLLALEGARGHDERQAFLFNP